MSNTVNLHDVQIKGFMRQIDKVGRFALPSDYRAFHQLEEGTPIEVINTEEGLFLSLLVGETLRGLVRELDSQGRIVIPKSFRRQNNISAGDLFEAFPCRDGLLLRKTAE